jgi:hypothetical protein
MARPWLYPRARSILLRARTGESSVSLVYMGCHPRRRKTSLRPASDYSGTRMVVTYLVQRIRGKQLFRQLDRTLLNAVALFP